MTQHALTEDEQDQILEKLKVAEDEQAAVITYEANKAAGIVRRDACYTSIESLCNAIGLAAIPSPITEIHQGWYSDGTKEPKLYINEALPSPLPDPPA